MNKRHAWWISVIRFLVHYVLSGPQFMPPNQPFNY